MKKDLEPQAPLSNEQEELNRQAMEASKEAKVRFEVWSKGDLPLSTIETLRGLVYLHRDTPDTFSVEDVFRHVLLGFYDCMWDGLHEECGNMVYRLSDFVPEEQRKKIDIYSSPTGSIINEHGNKYDSLEDWRKQWEKARDGNIPYFQEQLPSAIKELGLIIAGTTP